MTAASTTEVATAVRPAAEIGVAAAVAHVPGVAADLLLPGTATAAGADPEPGCEVVDAHQLLGRKGLLYKEPATRLALCAVHRALGLPPGRPQRADPAGPRTAVIVSSNLGNVETVCGIVDRVRAGEGHEVSPLQAPNASSNVIASTIAIRYGFSGPNVTVCSGATAGLDAIRLGALLVRAGRAERAVVAGVEPADEVAARLLALRGPGRPRAAAAAVILQPAVRSVRGDGGVAVRLGPVVRHTEPAPPVPAPVPAGLTLLPHAVPGTAGTDLSALLGETYGATGVLQVALAARWLQLGAGGGAASTAVLTCGDPVDGYASTWLSRE